MQARLCRGICLLAFLSSVGRAQDFNHSKQSDKSNMSELKKGVIDNENSNRQASNNDLSAVDALRTDEEHNALGSGTSSFITSNLSNQSERKSTQFLKDNRPNPHLLSPKHAVRVTNRSKRSGSDVLNDVKQTDILSALDAPEFNSEINEIPNIFAVKSHFSPFSPDLFLGLIPTGTDLENQEREANKPNSLIGQTNNFSPMQYSYKSEDERDGFNLDINTDGIDESKLNNVYPYTPNFEKTDDNSNDLDKTNERSALFFQYPGEGSAKAYAGVNTVNNFNAHNQVLSPYPYISNDAINSGSLVSGNSLVQATPINRLNTKSRVIWPSEYIFPYQIMGDENVIRCSRANEFHHFWSQALDCLVCVCSTEFGPLQPVCASCSGCQIFHPQDIRPDVSIDMIPEPYVPLPISQFPPYKPDVEPTTSTLRNSTKMTTPLPLEASATCKPLPIEEPFTNPLQPCQLCVCREIMNIFGKIDVRIDCYDNPHCVVPVDVNVLPPMPEIPVPIPLPLCEKFPSNVPFPHPIERCKKCKCSVELSAYGIPEQQITCFVDINCDTIIEPSPLPLTPPAPLIVKPVQPYPMPIPKSITEIPLSPPEVNPVEPIPWPPVSTTISPPVLPPPQVGPLPGPSPHKTCQPYPPNQPFQHPWDPCQICQCAESQAVGLINVEISCYTKLTCCIVIPDDMPGDGEAQKGQEYQIYNGLISGASKLPVIYSKPDGLQGYPNPYLPANDKNTPSYSQFGSAISQTYDTVNVQSSSSDLLASSKPRSLYFSYNSENSSPSYIESIAQYQNFTTLPMKVSGLYDQQRELYMNPVNLQANTKFNSIRPQPSYKPEVYEYKDIKTRDFNPIALYGQYNTGFIQNQDGNNIQYRPIYPTENPFFYSYPSGEPQNLEYTSANAQSQNSLTNPLQSDAQSGGYALTQNSLNSPRYYLPSSYQSANAISSVNNDNQLSGVAEANAQSQVYSSYPQQAPVAGTNGYPYQTVHYTGYVSPQFQSYSGANNQELDLYTPNPINYVGKYDYNGQPNAINVLKPENSYYAAGYSQNSALNDLYLPLYPQNINYNINPLQFPGPFGSSNAQGVGVMNLQTKSAEDLREDKDENKD